MKQSLLIQRSKFMPKYGERFPDGRFYVFQNALRKSEPRDSSRAMYADINSTHAHEWGMKNLGHDCYTVASRA